MMDNTKKYHYLQYRKKIPVYTLAKLSNESIDDKKIILVYKLRETFRRSSYMTVIKSPIRAIKGNLLLTGEIIFGLITKCHQKRFRKIIPKQFKRTRNRWQT